ncbi:MAG: three-Cys-motif partner protein TcmP [Planctomycetales bacterium]|nr:three-Cys-motif partner protein TcmP [Planctomycetales bacterium]
MAKVFFNEQAEQSQVKTAIVTKYFGHWAKVITGYLKGQKKDTRIAYIDLFAGPGRYEDGTKSTPLLILEQAIADPLMRDSLVTIFNDKDEDNSNRLQTAINALPGIETLKIAPQVNRQEVGEEIVKMFESMKLIPTLFFVDPWGYKGLSLRLINSVLKNWACECIFFFNYNRINAGLSNEFVREHMEALFGSRAAELAVILEPLSPDQRELTIIEEICKALVAMGGKYVLPFCFKNEKGTRTSHHLIFVSKDPLGYEIMKTVMANASTTVEQGVASFDYNPADNRQPLLFELARPLDDLEEMLLETFAGKTLTLEQIYQQHNYGRRYIRKNYKEVLSKMEIAGKIVADPPKEKRRKLKGEVTFADHVKVTFKEGTKR